MWVEGCRLPHSHPTRECGRRSAALPHTWHPQILRGSAPQTPFRRGQGLLLAACCTGYKYCLPLTEAATLWPSAKSWQLKCNSVIDWGSKLHIRAVTTCYPQMDTNSDTYLSLLGSSTPPDLVNEAAAFRLRRLSISQIKFNILPGWSRIHWVNRGPMTLRGPHGAYAWAQADTAWTLCYGGRPQL
jgi:hypothetical protein